MKILRKKLLCFALTLCVLMSLAPMSALAVNGEIPALSAPAAEGAADTSEVAAVIGDAAQSVSDGAGQVAEDMAPGDLIQGDLYDTDFSTYEYVRNELNEALQLRKEEIYLYLKSDSQLTDLYLDLMMMDASSMLVGTYGGDYLLCSIFDYGYYAEYIEDNGIYYYIIGYAVVYSTTTEQEQELQQKISDLQDTVLGDAVNEYQKIKAIHDYIINNVEYDLENASNADNPLPHTAYAALMSGKATMQGYVMLFDYMARQYGISSNIVLGTVEDLAFMWNIVRCDDVWYNINIVANELDSTDVYFMKGSTDFPDGHVRAELYLTEEYVSNHPMSETAYVPEKAMGGIAGENITWYYNAVTNKVHVVGSGRMDDDISIPNIYGGNPSLVIEEGITYIGKNAFNSKSFDTVQLPDSLVEIGDYAFANSNVRIVSGGKNLSVIGDGAFAHCYNLKDYVIPASVTEIGGVAFYDVPMKQAIISERVTKIGANAFENDLFEGYVVDEKNPVYSGHEGSLYSKDMKELVAYAGRSVAAIELPDTVTIIGTGAFGSVYSYSIYVPPSVTVIKKQAFHMSGNVPEVYYGGTQAQWDAITIEEGNEYLTNGTLHTETYAVSGGGWYLDLSNGAMTAGGTISSNEGVFAWDPWRDKITSLEFNEHTYWFESGCFKDCVNLKTIRFNSEHLAIFGDAFAGCTGLTDIYYNESESKWKEEGNDKAFPDSPNLTVHFKALPTSGSWGDNAKWTYDEQTGVLVISGQGALYGRDNRTWEHWSGYVRVIIVEEGITDLGNQAFYGCSKLVRLVLPEGVTTIGQYTFHGTSLNDITLPVSLKSVDAGVLMSGGPNTDIHYKGTEAQWNAIEFGENNDGFTRANIHFDTTCDHDMVIEYAKTPTCLEEGNTMGKHCTVCNQVFAEKRTLPKAAHAFEFDHSDFSGYKCFRCGTDLDESVPTSGEFGNGLTWSYSFKNGNVMFSYNELTISGQGEMPDFADPSETPWSMFTTDIERVVLTDGVDSVGNRAFEGCANLKNVLFSDVVSIGDHAFDGCVNLNNMTIESPVKNIGDSAFRGCDGLVEVVYYGSEKEWKNVEVGSGNEDLLNTGFIFANPVDYVPNPFTDVAKSDWFANPVLWAYNTGVTGGTSATTFGPNNFCTRAQVVTFLYAAAGKPEVTTAENPFEDVADDAWYAKPVLWAVENGITSGIDATHFGPDVTCTRAQVVTFLYAAAGKPEITASSTFSDVADGDWFAKPVIWAKENDVTGGISATEFGPNNTCTRAQVVTFLYKVYG